MHLLSVFFVLAVSLRLTRSDYCKDETVWLEKTEYRPIPVYQGGKASKEHYTPVYQTVTQINSQSVPYYVTQTQNVPQYVTRKAILPQYVTHTVVHTHPKYLTVTEKTFITVTATRTRKAYETVCPKGYGHQDIHGGGHQGYH